MTNTSDSEMVSIAPELKRKKGISPIWILPLIAVTIAAWLVYKSVMNAGVDVTITFKNAQGIEAGKTQVVFRGMPIGLVKDLQIRKDFESVDVHVQFVKEAKDQLKKGTEFWKVEPEISARGISGLETLLKGNYITMRPGEGEEADHFEALSDPPPFRFDTPGLHIHAFAQDLGALKAGSGIYYKGIKVGEIIQTHLDDKGKSDLVLDLFIQEKYRNLVKKTTKFFNISGIVFEGGLSGFTLKAESMESLFLGGISFLNPEHGSKAQNAKDDDTFRLFKDKDSAEQEGQTFTVYFQDGNGLSSRTQIKYRGVEVGKAFSVELDEKTDGVRLQATMQQKYRKLLRKDTQFWVVKPQLGLAKTRNLDTLLSGSYLTFQPGKGKPEKSFKGLNSPPGEAEIKGGLHVVLESERLGSLKSGDPVYYRQVKVGEVTGCRLSKDATSTLISVDIRTQYAPIVRTTSKFWKASGLKVNFSLFSGAKIQTESMAALLEGGIAFATPGTSDLEEKKEDKSRGVVFDGSKNSQKKNVKPKTGIQVSGRPAKNGITFQLYSEAQEEWLKWRPRIALGKSK
jgi:paraquat-inducible protein B